MILKRQRRFLVPALCAVLFVGCLFGWAMAQSGGKGGVSVLIDKDRNAVLQTDSQGPGAGPTTPTGTSAVAMDFEKGLSTVKVTLQPTAEMRTKMQGATGNLYTQVGNDNSLLIGDFKVTLPPEAKMTLDFSALLSQTGKTGHVEGKIDLAVAPAKANPSPVTRFSVDGTSKSDYKTATTKLNYSVDSTDIQKKSSLKSLKLSISEAAGKDAVTTTVDFNATGDAAGSFGQMLTQMGGKDKFTEMIKKGLERASIKVESVEVSKAEVTGDTAALAFVIKASGLRQQVTMMLDLMVLSRLQAQGMDSQAIKAGIDTMLQAQAEKLDVEAKFEKDTVSGTIDMGMRNMDKFLEGYFTIAEAMQGANFKKMEEKAQDKPSQMALKWAQAIQKHSFAFNRQFFTSMAANGASQEGSFKLAVDLKDPANIKVTGEARQHTSNLEKAMAEMRQKGYNLPERTGALIKIAAKGGDLTGSVYSTSQGNIWEFLKAYLVTPAKSEADLKDAVDMITNLKLEDLRLTGALGGDKIDLVGYMKTSDLSPVIAAIQKVAAPNVVGVATGLRADMSSTAEGQKSGFKLGFKGFMKDKSADDIKTALSMSGADVKENVEAAQVALSPAIEQPKVELPSALASLQSASEKEMFPQGLKGPIAGETGGSSGGGIGGMSTGALAAIGGGVVLLLIVLVVAMKKK